jgi:FtsH-binding integral membrane protein
MAGGNMMRALLLLAGLAAASAHQAPLPRLRRQPFTAVERLRGGASTRFSSPSFAQPSDGMSEAERVYVAQQFARPAVRTGFIARVYSVVMLQVLATAAIMAALRRAPVLAEQLMPRSPLFFLLAMAPALAIQLAPRVAEQALYGHLLLAAFTALTAVGLGASTSPLPSSMLIEAAVATSAAVAGLAAYATSTKRDFTAGRGMLSAGLLALLAMGVLQMLTGAE